ncbi:DUF2750 domain-containing protein [Croceibacter atlanticus]|jgi:hypothetical protein|uniref:DUF2750 domain-containing protein n=1 Tax=Croceibacter atlanticus (strain ATCC BAA-628 / JCM 21780 / CIP 108009 / IAM 15332 / KCTC 12090 / HTCC2559) TaxID=216432 RepID=A3U4K1_CROAH|nr:DUF2750 domain-containing protein [Croceibacter atlanticus]EAP87168.1 hypothetical protein CA2559_00395 [Croceibacter atlanticus HTCC2559]
MFQDFITLKTRHLRFVKTVSDSEIVYGLKSKNGYATSSSTQYEDDVGKPIGMICFWAEKVRAKSCAKDDWKKYKVSEIPLAEFMENWCIGMANDGLLIGTQFDQNLLGHEVEPLDLILELTSELKSIEKDLNFKKFNGIADLEKQVKEINE